MIERPMLAGEVKLEKLVYPLLASYKLDGIRTLIFEDMAKSRTMKMIPNEYFQRQVALYPFLAGLDGETVVGPANAANAMQASTSGLMSVDGEPDFTIWVFDTFTNPDKAYQIRYMDLADYFAHNVTPGFVRLLDHKLIYSEVELLQYEQQATDDGFEGLCVRSLDGKYKQGRSTTNQGWLLKLKRFKDGEMVVTGAEERMHNANEATVDELGYTKRSSHKENLIPAGTLGALLGEDLETGMPVRLGTGWDAATAAGLWTRHLNGTLNGTIVKYKHFAQTGVKVKRRLPVFISERDRRDM